MARVGIVVAFDAQIEWMFPWFVQNLQAVSSAPLFVIDLGISEEKKKRWSPHFTFQTLDRSFLTLSDPPFSTQAVWKHAYAGNFQLGRQARLLKPFALDLTPFDTTLWLDLDCEVRAPLDDIFSYAQNPLGMAMALEREASHARGRDLGLLHEGEKLYNSGVIVYQKHSPLLKAWQAKTIAEGSHYIGDQELFSRLLFDQGIHLPHLPSHYNWRIADGPGEQAHIIHWVGDGGKRHILERLMLSL